MKILVIPTTDWLRHPVPNRLNFIFDLLGERHEVFVLHFGIGQFSHNPPRATVCHLIESGPIRVSDPSLFYLLNAPFHLATLIKTAKREQIDVILSANILPSFLANLTGVPIVFDYLDHLEESASIYYPGSLKGSLVQWFTRIITRFNLGHAASVITVTRDFEEYLRGIGLCDITVIPNGVDANILSPIPSDDAKRSLNLEGKIVIGYIGSLEHWVDLETVIRALPDTDATLLVVGPGLFTDYGNLLKELADTLGVADRVIFTGAVKFQELNRYISAMDIGLNPLKPIEKNQRTIGGKIFNYLSCGIPVLSSRMAALERFFGDVLYYYDDEESFARQVALILGKPSEHERYRSIARNFDWKILSQRYEEALQRVRECRAQ